MLSHILYTFRLYVAGETPSSALAIANLSALCRARLPDRHKIEIIDVFRQPKRAMADGIIMTPTLFKLGPAPIRKIVGTLSQTLLVTQALGLEADAA
jgi:circadian clock protein KaiB